MGRPPAQRPHPGPSCRRTLESHSNALPLDAKTLQFAETRMRALRSCKVQLAIAVASCACLAACGADKRSQARRSVESGEALRQVQVMLDRSPQCAMLFTGETPIRARAGAERRPSVQALVAAGLISPGLRETSGTLDYHPTDFGRSFIRLGTPDSMSTTLCYAKRKVVRVWLKPAAGESDTVPTLGYAYKLVNAAPWALRGDVNSAFPFLRQALSQTFIPGDGIFYEKSHWVSDFIVPMIRKSNFQEAFLY